MQVESDGVVEIIEQAKHVVPDVQVRYVATDPSMLREEMRSQRLLAAELFQAWSAYVSLIHRALSRIPLV